MNESGERTVQDPVPQCDCGYACRGATLDERVRDGQRHALEVHGIEVSADQVLTNDQERSATG